MGSEVFSFWNILDDISRNLEHRRLADVFRLVSFQPGETYEEHSHLRIEINYVKRGDCFLCCEGEEVRFREKELMIVGSNARHAFRAGQEGAVLMQLEFLPEIFRSLAVTSPGAGDSVAEPFFPETTPLIKIVNHVRIMRAVRNIINELTGEKPYFRQLVVMHYAELLLLICRYMNEACLPLPAGDTLKKAVSCIRDRYRHDLSVAEIARCAGVGERYLHKLFVRHFSLAPLDYLNRFRIDQALELLQNTDLSVKEISFSCGFRSPQYFARIFRRYCGCSPREWEYRRRSEDFLPE